MFKKILLIILFLFIAAAAYLKYAVSKFEYSFSIKEYKPARIDLGEGAVINIILNLIIKSSLFFSVPVESLYYEVYYKDKMIGKSAGRSGFIIKKKGETTAFDQSIDVIINKNNIEVIKNYINKVPTDFVARVMVTVFGISISLKKINFTY
jgi:LEA14-like dessication related protein